MRTIIATVIGAGMLLTGALAQQDEQEHPAGNMSNMECCKSMQGAGQMQGMNMPMMHQMMTGHGDAAKLVDQLVASLDSIEKEKNQKVLKQKLAAHGALLKELQMKLQAPMPMGGMPGSMKADEDHKH
ncbi:MAG TPA: hypothetical protein VG273_03770 [Bryobacteraceae bacterium]|jgi:hypothetical protein|nr:hypothetical protein [Bryobacteraceae bacterium]